MIELALIAAAIVLAASLIGGWPAFVLSALICGGALGVIAAVLLVSVAFAESLTDALEHLTEPIRGPRR